MFDERMYADAINSLSVSDHHSNQSGPFKELDRLLEFRASVVEWARGWGGVAWWNEGLDQSFNIAVEENRVDLWREQVSNHMELGRSILGRLHEMDGKLPDERWKVRELWRLKIELVEIVVKGITTLDIKSSILPGSCTVEYTGGRAMQESVNGSMMATDDSWDGGDSDDDDEGEAGSSSES